MVAYQIGAAQAVAYYSGHCITYVKPHGALSNLSEVEPEVSVAVARAIRAVDASLVFLAIVISEQVRAAETLGIRAVSEIYADRGYNEEGRLIPRGEPGALIEDPDEAAARVLAMVEAGGIITATGTLLKAPVDSVCTHGDSPHAVGMARRVRTRLEAVGVRVAPFAAL
jgi:5-oxoprolinase (ATP-hydrolysing) subunit A